MRSRAEQRRPRESARRRASPAQRERVERMRRDTRDALEGAGVRSFGHEYRRLLRITNAEDFSSTQASQALLRAALGDAIQRLGQLGRHDDTRAAYAAVQLGGYLRDLIHDLRMGGDQSQLIERVHREVSRQVLASLATDVVSRLTEAREGLHRGVGERARPVVRRELNAVQRDLAQIFADAHDRALALLTRTLEVP